MALGLAEYIWIDGDRPIQKIRTKTRVVDCENQIKPSSFPEWNFDGSSTHQAEGHASDCILKPVFVIKDPLRGENNYLVLCEVYTDKGLPHSSNQRHKLQEAMVFGASHDIYIGFEQEYVFMSNQKPLGWPVQGFPAPQGPYYCSVGADRAFGREIVEKHTRACLDAGLALFGTNAEVMPSQWEFQVGYRGFNNEAADPLTMSDHLWIGRYLLQRIAEQHGVTISLDSKPVKGDWNGSGMHTNFSTHAMRTSHTGRAAIDEAIVRLRENHKQHIENYGHNLHERLTGRHETCDITQFRSGPSDRGASIRIPVSVVENGCGYLEDRRPSANADPYVVACMLVNTICRPQP